MYVTIATILVVGLVVVIIFTATLSYIYTREVAKNYAEVQHDHQKKAAASDELDRALLTTLSDGGDLGDSIRKWQEGRAAAFPEFGGWSWDEVDLHKARRTELANRKQQLTARLLFRAVVGLAVLVLLFGSTAIGVYTYFARKGPVLPSASTFPPAWSVPDPFATSTDPTDAAALPNMSSVPDTNPPTGAPTEAPTAGQQPTSDQTDLNHNPQTLEAEPIP